MSTLDILLFVFRIVKFFFAILTITTISVYTIGKRIVIYAHNSGGNYEYLA